METQHRLHVSNCLPCPNNLCLVCVRFLRACGMVSKGAHPSHESQTSYEQCSTPAHRSKQRAFPAALSPPLCVKRQQRGGLWRRRGLAAQLNRAKGNGVLYHAKKAVARIWFFFSTNHHIRSHQSARLLHLHRILRPPSRAWEREERQQGENPPLFHLVLGHACVVHGASRAGGNRLKTEKTKE